MVNTRTIIREWLRTSKNTFGHDVNLKEGYGKIIAKLTIEKYWQNSDYNELNHPFYELVKNTKEKYKILSSHYFNADVLKLLLNYLENDLENKMQNLINNPPIIEEENPFYGETCAVETVIHKGKTITMDVIIHKEFREVWGLSKIVKSLQEEINLNGGLYLIYAECLEDKKGI